MPTAAIIGGTTLASGLIGANAANRAAGQQSRMFGQAQENMRPFQLPGQGAIGMLANMYGIDPATGQRTGAAFNPAALEDFRNSPDYQFALNTGVDAVNTSNAGRGLLRSGNTLRDLMTFGQGLATQQFGNYRGALERLAQMGAGAAGNIGQLMTGQGTAQASGTVGAANAWTGALGNAGNYYMLQSIMNPGGYGGNKGVTNAAGGYVPPSPFVSGSDGFNTVPWGAGP